MPAPKGKVKVKEPAKAAEQAKAHKAEAMKGSSKEAGHPTTQMPAASKEDPKSQKTATVDAKARPDSKVNSDPKAQKAESDPKSKLNPKVQKPGTSDSKAKVDPRAKLDPKRKAESDAKLNLDPKAQKAALDKKGKPNPRSEKEGSAPEMDPEPEQDEAVQQEEPYVNPFKIDNVYAHYLKQHPPRKPLSFDMSPLRRPRDKAILDPFKWSKTFVHPWGEEKTKDAESRAKEKRLLKLEADRLTKKYIRPCRPEDHHHKRISIYCQPHREPIYKLDIYGNPVVNEAGHLVYEPIYMLNALGTMLLDGAGNHIPVYRLDEGGNVELDAEGNPTPGPTYTLDAKGNALLDEAGNLIPEPEHVDLLDEQGNVVLDEHGHPKHQPRPVYMLDALGHVILDKDGNRTLGQSYRDVAGDVVLTAEGKPVPGRFQFGELDEEGQLLFVPKGDVLLDAEGVPLLERQEMTEEKMFRLAMEKEARKAKAFQEKLGKDRMMMITPLPKKPTAWRKYCASMYLPRSLKTVVYNDRGNPGDDWRKFEKKYTIKEMNHRMAVRLHGKVVLRIISENIL